MRIPLLNIKKILQAIAFSASVLWSVSALADFQDGSAAFLLGNYEKAFAEFMPLAKQGNPLAQASLGMMYYKGNGVPLSYQEAIKWYRKAAEQGHSLAQYDLGVMYEKGQGVPQDYQMAIKWWTKAAEQNHPFAQYNLGLTYAKHLSVPDDLITAYKWANMAATNHYEEAKKLLNMLRKNMTHAQIAEAQRLSEELIKRARVGKALVQPIDSPTLEAELKIIGELEKAAKVLNKNTPKMIDEDTRMDAATIGPGFRINTNYTLPKHSAGEINADQLAQNIRPTLKNYACSKKNMKLLLQYGADFVYLYHDKNGILITSITIDRNDCGLRKIVP